MVGNCKPVAFLNATSIETPAQEMSSGQEQPHIPEDLASAGPQASKDMTLDFPTR